MPTSARPATTLPSKTAVVSKALLRSSELLGLTAKELSTIVGLSEPSISRLKRSESGGPLTGKSYELALLFIRLYRSLDAIVGGDDTVARQWIRTDNTMLGGKPLNRIKTIDGLAHVLAYLDARRAPI
ncbi:MbcA/ParS/Xre antitoxin family protein [Phyllobacterium lublinensis]|jgi:transcriptional regulator with XRE-family HTH domain|uniref:MbcA/ParS/Xre antitoxin family protein n=1 Tax=Phyllobacterium lublinensis TaxID=2875708 RepID=UPI001CCF7EAA|nr:MbcA/ParS/Xre antitoxin family protein [Phyllobacterium sp. 2063]MBZ9653958.1 MbcA/ParS/Xre antitoxin family protein [Phyllobacterium sp. 2063]